MSSAAILLIPGCLCCDKTVNCLCADLDLAAGIGMRLNVVDLMPADLIGGTPGADPFYVNREGWPNTPYGKKGSAELGPFVELGGCNGVSYGIRLTLKYRIDRGSYERCPGSEPRYWWPGFGFCYWHGEAFHKVIFSSGENMMLSFVEAEVTTLWYMVPGPVIIALFWEAFRYAADCYVEVTNIECTDTTNEIVNPGFEVALGAEWTGAGFDGGAGSIVRDTGQHSSGVASLRITQTNTVGYYFANQSLVLTGFAHYCVMGKIKVQAGNVPSVRASIFLGAFSNNLLLNADLSKVGVWQFISCADWSPGADANGVLNLEVETTDATDAIVFFDELELIQL